MSRAALPPTEHAEAGFTIIEVLIALAVVAVSILAIGSVMSTNSRGVQSMESHVALAETAQAVMATAVPPRAELAEGVRTGVLRDMKWQVEVGPLGGGWAVPDADVRWIPELVKVQVRSASGATLELHTVRLMRRPRR